MKRVLAGVFCVLAVLNATALVSAKGPTTKITISGDALQTPIEITNPEVVKNFNVWSGRGTYYGGGADPAYEGTDGFIIDWASGPVADRPNGLRTFQVSFYTKNDEWPPNGKPDSQLVYVVSYAVDPVTGHGYVYLPGKSDQFYDLNTHSIFRKCEGNWFRANEAWQTAFRRAVTL